MSKYTWDIIKSDEVYNIVKTAKENGINWFDTAERYQMSEPRLAKALWYNNIHNSIIMTKSNPDRLKYVNQRQLSLSPYNITVLQIHQPGHLISIEKQINNLASVAKSANIKYIGVSGYNAKQVYQAIYYLKELGLELASNQVRYNLLKRDIETNEVMDVCKSNKVSILCYSPLEKGLLSGKYHNNSSRLNELPLLRRIKFNLILGKTRPLINLMLEISRQYDTYISNIALAWVLSKEMFVINGVSNSKQLENNIKSINIKLKKSEIDELNIVSKKTKLIYV